MVRLWLLCNISVYICLKQPFFNVFDWLVSNTLVADNKVKFYDLLSPLVGLNRELQSWILVENIASK